MDRTTREKINKGIKDLNYTTNQLDLTDTSRIRYTNPAKYTFFSSVTFSRVDYILDHTTGLHKFRRTAIRQSMFSDHRLVAEKGIESRVGKGQELGYRG